MADKVSISGIEAIGWGALTADCRAYFGCPITPDGDELEWFAREFPGKGRVFLRTSSELSSINMVWGAAATGARAMTITASVGWGLMQETMSHLVNAYLPAVIVVVQTAGPGQGTPQHSQMDYTPVTHGGGQGNYRHIVLAPASAQECYDLTQLAFHLADKYCNPVVVLLDTIVAETVEPVEMRKLELGPLPDKDWAVLGKGHHKDGQRRFATSGQGFIPTPTVPTYLALLHGLSDKVAKMKDNEVQCETLEIEDAGLVLVAFGYSARVCLEAMDTARAQGLKVGLVRPITLWPFPEQVIKSKAGNGTKFLVVEDNLGGMNEDVMLAVEGKSPVDVVNALDRHLPGAEGAIRSEKVLEKIKKLM